MLDSQGIGAPAYVNLISADKSDRSFSTHSDQDGHFKVVGVPPGSYVLHVDITKGDEEEPYFYPGVEKQEDAGIVVVGMGQEVKGYDLSLPATLMVMRVEGIVRYSDGRTVANAEVRLIAQEVTAGLPNIKHYSHTRTDEMGRFSLVGYKQIAYEVLAIDDYRLAIKEQRTQGRSVPLKIAPNTDTNFLEVIIPLVSRSNEPRANQQK